MHRTYSRKDYLEAPARLTGQSKAKFQSMPCHVIVIYTIRFGHPPVSTLDMVYKPLDRVQLACPAWCISPSIYHNHANFWTNSTLGLYSWCFVYTSSTSGSCWFIRPCRTLCSIHSPFLSSKNSHPRQRFHSRLRFYLCCNVLFTLLQVSISTTNGTSSLI